MKVTLVPNRVDRITTRRPFMKRDLDTSSGVDISFSSFSEGVFKDVHRVDFRDDRDLYFPELNLGCAYGLIGEQIDALPEDAPELVEVVAGNGNFCINNSVVDYFDYVVFLPDGKIKGVPSVAQLPA